MLFACSKVPLMKLQNMNTAYGFISVNRFMGFTPFVPKTKAVNIPLGDLSSEACYLISVNLQSSFAALQKGRVMKSFTECSRSYFDGRFHKRKNNVWVSRRKIDLLRMKFRTCMKWRIRACLRNFHVRSVASKFISNHNIIFSLLRV